MIVERLFSPDRLNEIANHPEVLPWVRGPLPGPLDLTPVVADRRNVALVGAHGAMVFAAVQPGIYEVHTLVEPAGRGRWTVAMAHDALAWMFTRTDAVELLTRCPAGNVAAKALCRHMRAELEFIASAGWFGPDGEPIAADVFVMTIARWVLRAPSLAPAADGDPVARRYAAAAAAIADAGQPDKAARLYNRWARLSQQAPITL